MSIGAYFEEAMKTIDTVFKEFLDEYRQCLDPETYSDYEDVIDLFTKFLNSRAYLFLSVRDEANFKALHREEDKEYCEIFGPEYIGDSEVEAFLSYNLVRNVLLDIDSLKAAVKVIHDLIEWMHANGYMADEIYRETEKDVRELTPDVPAAKELALLLLNYVDSHPAKKYTRRLSGYFEIEKIEPGKLWLYEYYTLGQTVGPVIVSREISSKAKVGWTVYLAVGKTGETWQPLLAGLAYPRFSGEL